MPERNGVTAITREEVPEMTIDWQSLLRRYMAINYVPMKGSEDAKLFSGVELATLEAIEAEVAELEFFECLDLETANPERTRVEELAAFATLEKVVAELQGEGLDIKWGSGSAEQVREHRVRIKSAVNRQDDC